MSAVRTRPAFCMHRKFASASRFKVYPCSSFTQMDAENQPYARDLLLDATATITDSLQSFGPEMIAFDFLKRGLLSLQDTLLGSGNMGSPTIDPFYNLCIQLCEVLSRKLVEFQSNPSELAGITVAEYNLYDFQSLLLRLFHGLSTYLNLKRWYAQVVSFPKFFNSYTKEPLSSTAKVNADAGNRCLACAASAIRDLEDHRIHIECLHESELGLKHYDLVNACLSMYSEQLGDLGHDFHPQDYCECVLTGSNHKTPRHDDIVIVRVGQEAMGHFSELGAQLLEDMARARKRGPGNRGVNVILKKYEDLEERFRGSLCSLRRDKTLVTYETLTRGYQLDFVGMTDEGLARLGWP